MRTFIKSLLAISALFFALALPAPSALAQCADQWLYGPDQGNRGIPGSVYALSQWTMDTPPGTRPVLIAGGGFAFAGQSSAKNLAYWDGDWHPFGSGASNTVYALCSYRGELIAAGSFVQINDLPIPGIARWNGATWQPLGLGISGTVRSLCVIGDTLYVGGSFTSAGGIPANNVAAWNGSHWSALGPGLTISTSVTPEVRALVEFNGRLFAGGLFTRSGTAIVSSFASWTGTDWKQEVSGLGNLRALRVYKGLLYAGGDSSSGTSVGIRSWDGSTWSTVAGGLYQAAGYAEANALFEFQGRLIVAGNFTRAGTVETNSVAAWDGTAWAAFGSGVPVAGDKLLAVADFDNQLVVAGFFSSGVPAARSIAMWNGDRWAGVGHGMYALSQPTQATSFCTWNGDLVMGGFFAAVGNATSSNVAVRRNGQWQSLGIGLPSGASNRAIECVASYGNLLVAGGTTFNRTSLAAWDGQAWSPLGGGITSGSVRALIVYRGDLIVGGQFSDATPANAKYLARWDGSKWYAFGVSPNSFVYSLAIYQGELVVGGDFSQIDGTSAAGIARWDGTRWASFGTGVGPAAPTIYSLAVHKGHLIAGGSFNGAAGRNSVARWDGQAWNSLGSGLSGGVVFGLADHNDALYATGSFTSSGSTQVSRVTRWNGTTWQPLGTGLNTTGSALYSFQNQLFIGGPFTLANNQLSVGWARYGGCTSCPADLTSDHQVNDDDFQLFSVAYDVFDCADPAMSANCASDFNNDGLVDDADFSVFVAAYDAQRCP